MRLILFVLILFSIGCGTATTKGSQSDAGTDGPSNVDPFDPTNLPECLFETGALGQAPIPEDHWVLNGESSDRAVSFLLALCPAAQGEGHSTIFRADHVELSWNGKRAVFDGEQIEYENTHHNWQDSLTADNGDSSISWFTRFESGENREDDRFLHNVSAELGGDSMPETTVEVSCEKCQPYQFGF